jgi:hypothetical protein
MWTFAESSFLMLQVKVVSISLEWTPHEGKNFCLLFTTVPEHLKLNNCLVHECM